MPRRRSLFALPSTHYRRDPPAHPDPRLNQTLITAKPEDTSMTDVMQIAKQKRSKLMDKAEKMMAEVEKLDGFIAYGETLAPESEDASDMHAMPHAAE